MQTKLQLRVPAGLPGGDRKPEQVTWLMGQFFDCAAQLAIQLDGAPGRIQAVSDLEISAPFYSGEYLEIRGELARWESDVRHVELEVRKIVGLVTAADGKADLGQAQVLHDPVQVATANLTYTPAELETKGQGAPPPLIITVAPTGFEVTRESTPYLPLTPDEIAAEVARCAVEGATVVHLHVRGPQGEITYDAARYNEVVERIRARCDIIVQVTTEGEASTDVVTRCAPLGTSGVEMASLTTGTVNRGAHIFFNSKPVMEHVALNIQRRGLVPAIEIFDSGFLENARSLARKGLLSLPGHFVLILGSKGGMGARRSTLEHMVELIPRGSHWSVAGIGRHHLPMAERALGLGGHVRVGLEDAVNLAPGTLAQGSASFVTKVVEMAKKRGRPIADTQTARRLLGLKTKS